MLERFWNLPWGLSAVVLSRLPLCEADPEPLPVVVAWTLEEPEATPCRAR